MRTAIRHREAISMIAECERLYDLRLLMHSFSDRILCFSFEELEEVENAVAAQELLICARRLVYAH